MGNDESQEVREVAALVQRLTGSHILKVEKLGGFVANSNYRLIGEAESWILKCPSAREAEIETWALDSMSSAGVPVPRLLHADSSGLTFAKPFLLLGTLDGTDSAAGEESMSEAGRQLRRVHEVPMSGFGFLKQNPTGAMAGPYDSWKRTLAQLVDDLQPLVEAKILAERMHGQLVARINEAASIVVPNSRFLHGDFHSRHLFTVGVRLAGIIDWSDVAGGDPWFDIARFSMSQDGYTDALLRGYLDGEQLPADFDIRIALYRLLWSTLALTWEFAVDGDWIVPRVEDIERQLQSF